MASQAAAKQYFNVATFSQSMMFAKPRKDMGCIRISTQLSFLVLIEI